MAKAKGDSNMMGALAYVLGWVTGIILYIVKKDDAFVRFHAMQSIIVFGALSILNFVLAITIIGLIVVPFLWLAGLVLWILLMVKAYQGEKYKLPMVGDLAEKHSK